MPDPLVDDQPAQAPVILLENAVVTADHRVRHIENAYFFREILVDHYRRVILHLATVFRAHTHIVEILAAVNESYDRRRYRNGDEYRHDPPHFRCRRENNDIAREFDKRAYDREGRADYRDRPHTGFAVCVFELFVEVRKVERGNVKVSRLLHYHNFDLSRDLLTGYSDDRTVEPLYDAPDNSADEKPDYQDKNG